MRKPFMAANWKMNKTVGEAVEFVNKLKQMELPDRDVLIGVPYTALKDSIMAAKDSKVKISAQNMHFEEKGAFTGEISPLMLKDVNCEYVIIGHSERRHVFGEEDEFLNKKVVSALDHDLKVIFCIGETLDEREHGETKEVVKRQILDGLNGIDDLSNITIAYEPVWAIGTGENATPVQAEEVHAFIRSMIEGKFSKEVASDLLILYGGSVKPGNVMKLMEQEDIDGVLVGGASLDLEQFSKIVNF
jgi:triosephosphate isomerase